MKPIPEIEFQSKESIRIFQNEKLREVIKYVSQHSPFYKKQFKDNDISINSILTMEDLAAIPVTTKDDLQQWNWDFLCVPRNKVA
jgi:phenylacetate-CoA ligase